MSSLTELYYQHWHTERLADALERFLAAHPDLSVGQLAEVLLVDQALQWQYAAGPSVEHYLQRFPAIMDQQSLVLELVCGELRAAHRLGLTVDANVFVARFPNLAEPLRRQMEVSDWLADKGKGTEPER